MSPVFLKWDQVCSSEHCTRPARHDDLCSACFRSVSAARRAVADLVDSLSAPVVVDILDRMRRDLALGDLEVLFALPAVEPGRRAA